MRRQATDNAVVTRYLLHSLSCFAPHFDAEGGVWLGFHLFGSFTDFAGRIGVKSTPGQGAAFQVTLKAIDGAV